jgi:hypothetical protein
VVGEGVRQGNCVSLLLLNVVMDEMIKEVKMQKGII